jgi:hypothetical protein
MVVADVEPLGLSVLVRLYQLVGHVLVKDQMATREGGSE